MNAEVDAGGARHAGVRAQDDFGEMYEALTPHALDALVEYVTETGGYLVVERADRVDGQFAQVILEGTSTENLWAVEVREATGLPHHRAVVTQIVHAQRALRAWSFDETDWRSVLDWTP